MLRKALGTSFTKPILISTFSKLSYECRPFKRENQQQFVDLHNEYIDIIKVQLPASHKLLNIDKAFLPEDHDDKILIALSLLNKYNYEFLAKRFLANNSGDPKKNSDDPEKNSSDIIHSRETYVLDNVRYTNIESLTNDTYTYCLTRQMDGEMYKIIRTGKLDLTEETIFICDKPDPTNWYAGFEQIDTTNGVICHKKKRVFPNLMIFCANLP